MHSAIQADTHDSIEDARTALQLYEEYNRLEAEGSWEDILEEVYTQGKQTVSLYHALFDLELAHLDVCDSFRRISKSRLLILLRQLASRHQRSHLVLLDLYQINNLCLCEMEDRLLTVEEDSWVERKLSLGLTKCCNHHHLIPTDSLSST